MSDNDLILPHVKYFYDSNIIWIKSWIIKDLFHRLDGPAYIKYYKNGQIEEEAWYINGLRHCVEGPAEFWYFDDGELKYTRWWLYGIRVGEKVRKWLNENNIIAPYSNEDLMAFKLRWT